MSSHRPTLFIIRLAAALAGLLCLAFLTGVIILHTQPRLLLDPVEKMVGEALPGSQFKAFSARPSLWPSPGVILHDVVLTLPDGNALFAESLEYHLSWPAIFRRTLSPALLVLDGFNARLIWPDRPSSTPLLTGGAWQQVPEALHGLKIHLHDGHLEMLAPAASTDIALSAAPLLDLRTINGSLLLPSATHSGALELQVGTLRQTIFDGSSLPIPHTLRQLDVRLDGLLADPFAPLGLHLRHATVTLQGNRDNFLESLALQVQLTPPQGTTLQGSILFEAELRPDAWPVSARPLRLNADLPFAFTSGPQWNLHLDDGRVALDSDSARLTMTVHSDATASGTARVEHLSLPRWFTFARALPDGLITALDALSGTLAFTIDAHGVDVPDLKASLAGHAFTGSASLTDFQHPTLQLKASTQMADLGRLLPELCGAQPKGPVFDTPALDADPEEAALNTSKKNTLPGGADSDSISLNYDIQLRTTEARLASLSGKGMSLAIAPAPTNPDATRLTLGVESLYGGSAAATLDIADRCAIQLTAKKLDARILDTCLPAGVTPKGTMNLSATLSAPADSLDAFKRQLAGSASVELLNGSLNIAGSRQAFSRLQLSTTGKVSRTEDSAKAPTKQFWKGTWKLIARSSSPSVPLAPLDITLALDGETGFLTHPFMPIGGRQLGLRATGTVLGGVTDCAATLDLALAQGSLTLRNVRGSLAGCTVQGGVSASSLFSSPTWTAQGNVACGNLAFLLRQLKVPLPRPGATFPKSFSLSASLAFDRTTLRLDKLNGKLDETSFQGSILRTQRALPHWDITLHLDRLNLSSYLPSSGKGAASSEPTARLLRSMTLNATMDARELVLGEIPFQQVSIKATLEDGTLRIAPVSASCCGGPVSATLSATARQDDTTATTLRCSVSDADLSKLSDAADADIRLRGKAWFDTQLTGVFRTLDQLSAAQSGTWNLTLGAGSFTSLDPRTKKTGSTYHIRSASASGTLKNEAITCNDLHIQGKDFNARGRGIINLRNNTLDYTINASIPGVPDIPIRYSGSLNDPTRRINAFKTLASVFSNVGHHAFSLMKDIINVPFSLIK